MYDGIKEITEYDSQIRIQQNRIISRERIFAPRKLVKLLIAKIKNKDYDALLKKFQLEKYSKKVKHLFNKEICPSGYKFETDSVLLT